MDERDPGERDRMSASTSRPIELTPPNRGVYFFLATAMAAYLAFLVYLYASTADGVTPELQQEHFRGMLMTAVISVLTGAPILWALGRRSLVITEGVLELRAGFYRAKVPLSELRVDEASVVSLFERGDLGPRWRTNGIRLPGYRVGWFRLRNGDKALLYLTDVSRVTRLPTAKGYVLMLSTEALLPALRATRPGNIG